MSKEKGNEPDKSEERELTIKNKYGLHARPAAMFVKTAARYRSDIIVIKGDSVVSAKSIMGLLTLEGSKGSHLVIKAEGEDAVDALDALTELIDRKFDED